MEPMWKKLENNEPYTPKRDVEEFTPIIKNKPENTKITCDFFKLFFSDKVIETIVKQTNHYAAHKKQKFLTEKSKVLNEMIIEDDEIVDSEYVDDDKSKILKTATKWKDITKHGLELFISKFIINCLVIYIYIVCSNFLITLFIGLKMNYCELKPQKFFHYGNTILFKCLYISLTLK